MIGIRKQRGFTLIELVIVITILGVISVVIGRVLLQGYDTMLTSEQVSSTGSQGLIALEKFTNDVHRIRSKADITTITSTQLTFTDVNGTSVQYSLSSGNLMRSSQILADGVQTLTFNYMDEDGNTTATAANVRYIKMTLALTKSGMTLSMATIAGTRGLQ